MENRRVTPRDFGVNQFMLSTQCQFNLIVVEEYLMYAIAFYLNMEKMVVTLEIVRGAVG